MNKYIFIYIAIISLLAVVLTVRDKNAARNNAWRVKERTLLTVSVFGGSAAMLLTMLVVRHKTRKHKFMIGLPIIIAVQAAIVIFAFDTSLSVGRYDIETDKIDGQIKLILVTDFHSCDYGDGQIELISAIDAETPDAVLPDLVLSGHAHGGQWRIPLILETACFHRIKGCFLNTQTVNTSLAKRN